MKALPAIAAIAGIAASSAAAAGDPMKAFPAADEGMARHVLHLPEREDESAFKVELVVGKTVELDEVNRYFFGGRIEAANIDGWGFTRYVVNELGPMAGTRIGVPPDAPRAPRFIRLGGEPHLVRYNSRLPLVVYVPAGADVRYRIWAAEPDLKPMPGG